VTKGTCPHCPRPIRYAGLCNAHYLRKLRHGDPLASAPKRTMRERFDAKVVRTPDHWKWRGAHFKQTGYALFSVKGEDGKWRPTTAHRIAWQLYVGPIPPGMVPDHVRGRCGDRGCVKAIADEHGPAHLELVTARENMLRGDAPSAIAVRTNRCQRGHEFTPENTYERWRNGKLKRDCRECARARDRVRNKTEKRREHYRALYRRRKAEASD
jgi:HNH endonuclease